MNVRSQVYAFRHLVVFGLLMQSTPGLAETIDGRAVGVSDGDTISVLDGANLQHKIRLAGIDAPESRQAFGQASKRHLSAMVFNRHVTLNCGKADKFRRKVCVVTSDGRDVNLAQVTAGMAWWYRKYQKEQMAQQRVDYEAAESQAKAAKRGLWADAEPVPPWEWRHR